MNIGITLHDPETGTILGVNDRLEQLYGYSECELRTMSVEDYTAPTTKFTQKEAINRIRAAAGGDSQMFEWKIERKNGEYRWVSVHLIPTTIDGNTYVVAEIAEITEYRAREQLIRLMNRIIRHNLRNDMNILIGYADRVKTATENNQVEEEIETILTIASEVGTLSDSLDQIEKIVRPDATQREPTNLRAVVQTCAEGIREKHPEVELTVDVPSDIWVNADKSLQYAVENAIDNAVVHNDSDTPKVKLSTVDDHANGFGVMQIADNGPSIPDMEIDVLDDETVKDSTYHGSGVGLWVMKWCVDSLGGELSFEERTPRGNVVRISIPKAGFSSVDQKASDSGVRR